jgi:hypothetical protein
MTSALWVRTVAAAQIPSSTIHRWLAMGMLAVGTMSDPALADESSNGFLSNWRHGEGVAPLLGTRDRERQGRRPTAQHRAGDRCPHAFAHCGGRTRRTCTGGPYRPSKQLDASCRQPRGRDVGLAAAPIAAHRPPVVPGASRRSHNRTDTHRHLRRARIDAFARREPEAFALTASAAALLVLACVMAVPLLVV